MRFFYQSRSKIGELKKGIVEAESKKAALEALEKYGLYVTSLKQEPTTKLKKDINIKIPFLKEVPQKEIVAFTRQLSVMLRSAIPPLQAIKAQASQIKNQRFQAILWKMVQSIEMGTPLSQALALSPQVFNQFFISMVKSGEATGKVADSLFYLADHLEEEYNFNQKVFGAMIYPIFILFALTAAFFLAIFFIVPKLREILESFTGNLPWATKLIIGLSDFIKAGGWIGFLLVFGAIAALPVVLKKNKEAKIAYDSLILKVPVLGKFFAKVYLVRFTENLSVLISAGLPINQALNITYDIVGNTVYQKIIKEISDRVAKGEKISAVVFEKPNQIPPFVSQMISTGEETGKLDETLMDAVRFYRQEIERTTANLTTIIEPVLILIIGVAIAIFAVSIFIPLFKIGMGGMTG
ncbi:MAG: type II secretion system F family protein [Candidatus Pacebacteria bacterium]|nr:type II secretion system F family protein [Candidatus Paceibacterota bacterium]